MGVHLNDLGGWIVVLTAPSKVKGTIVPVQGMAVRIIPKARRHRSGHRSRSHIDGEEIRDKISR